MKPAGRIAPPDWMRAPETQVLVAALTAKGDAARFVGGCVRDAVLGRPAGDIDLATPARPETVMARLAAASIRAIPTGLAHGTVSAVIGPRRFEITTLRRDVETDGRHARVAFTDDWAADAARRDFTINALYCDDDGTLYDPVGGLADLRARRVRFVGDARARIREDVLRLLRFFRFYAWYGRPPADAEALAACREMAPALPRLSGERVAAELLRLLAAPDPLEAVALMERTGALAEILPEAGPAATLVPLIAAEGRAGIAPDGLRRPARLLRAGGGGADAAARVAARLRLSNAKRARLAALVAPGEISGVVVAADLDGAGVRRALYRAGAERFVGFVDLVLLAWAETPDAAAAFAAMIETAGTWTPPAFPLRGADALAAGMAPGPDVGRLLAGIEDDWVAGGFKDGRDALLDTLRERVAAARKE